MTGTRKAIAPRRNAKRNRVAIVAVGASAAVVASLLTVAAITSPFDVAGKSIDMALDQIEPMERPSATKGVKLSDPTKDDSPEQPTSPPVKPKEKCGETDTEEPELGLKSGEEGCARPESGQAEDLLDSPHFELVQGSESTRVPGEGDPAKPTPVDPTPEEEPSEETPSPEGSPTPTPSATPTPDESGSGEGSTENASLRRRGSQFMTPTGLAAVESTSDSTYLSPNWIQSSSTPSPGARQLSAMAYDQARKQMVMFGGRKPDGTYSNETWVWAQGAWTQVTPTASPSARQAASMVWDPSQQAIILFGGNNTAGFQSDLWKWTGTTWTQVTPSSTTNPVGRTGASMAYDPQRAGLVLFGGSTATSQRNDTWQLKNNSWTQLQAQGASGAPTARSGASLAYSESTSQLVLFGGYDGSGATAVRLNDTKILGATASSWTAVNPVHKPTGRNLASMAFDRGIEGLVLFGGTSADGSSLTYRSDTWAWNGEDWLLADGIAAPAGRNAAAMAATTTGQVVMFGGANASSVRSDTWVYDAGLPVLEISVTNGSADGSSSRPFYAGESAEISINAVNAGAHEITPSQRSTITAQLPKTLLASGTQIKFDDAVIDQCSGNASTLCGGVSDLVTTIANLEIPAAASRLVDFVATVAGTQRGCELINIPALASSIFGGSTSVSTNLTVCGGGLGIEDWWTYDTTDLGGGGTASVNVANGNLVVKQYDSTPIQTRGQLAMALGRAYNSQDLMSGGGPLGAGWQFDIGETGETAGGFGIAGLKLPNLQTVTQPLSMPYIDRDGTRHVFKLRSVGLAVGDLSLPIDLSEGVTGVGASILGLLGSGNPPFDQSYDEGEDTPKNPHYSGLCIDQAYTGPPGSNMFLFRYVGVGASGCTNAASPSTVTVGWSLVKPDRVRYDFNLLGDLVAVTDASGQQLRYTPGVLYGPTKIVSGSCKTGSACPSITIDYDAGGAGLNRHVKVTDSAKRVTSYVVSRSLLGPRLLEVWEPGNPLSSATGATPSASYTYSEFNAPCADSSSNASTIGQICSVTDANGATTRFTYTAAPKGADRILQVTDRRGTVAADGATKGLATRYTWDDAGDFVTADMAAPANVAACDGNAACQRIRYSDIDEAGRVGQIAEGSSDNTYLRQSGYFWDNETTGSCSYPQNTLNNNLCQTIKRAVPSNAPFEAGVAGTATQNGTTVSDEAISYTYGALGQMLRKKVLLDAASPWTDANSSITTWGSHEQYFDANGRQRAFNTHVKGDGQIGAGASQNNYRAAVLSDGPNSYWRLGEAASSGSTMNAEVGNNGTYVGDVTKGLPGALANNTAVGDRVTTNLPPGTDVPAGAEAPLNGFAHGTSSIDSDFTIESWANTTSTATQGTFQWHGTADRNKRAVVGRMSGGYPMIRIFSDVAASKDITVYSPASIADGQWHHLAYTYDGSGQASGAAIWVDGVKVPLTVVSDDLDGDYALSNTGALLLASAAAGSVTDEVSIYTRVLSGKTITKHRDAALGGKKVEPDTLYGVTDQIQELTPRGNASANWGEYLTSIRRDIPEDGSMASTNKPAGSTICDSGSRGNTGLVCEVDTPASSGVPRAACTSATTDLPAGSPTAPTSGTYTSTCTKYQYNAFGQRSKMRTPKMNADSSDKWFEYKYYDVATDCSGDNRRNCDLTGSVSAGGWLKAVIDPDGKKVVTAHDAAGNVARTWDRNATEGKSLDDATWTDANAPPSPAFSDTLSATPVTSDAFSISNTAVVTAGPDGVPSGAGNNASGELGDGTTSSRSTPVTSIAVDNVVQVAQSSTGALSGCSFTIFRTGKGDVWATGAGTSTPFKLGLSDIISVAAGGCHGLALDAKGQLWAWGSNSNGQLGNGSTSDSTTPVKVLDDVSTIGAGYLQSLATKTDGSLWTWGANNLGQLGLGDTNQRTSPTRVTTLGGVRAVSGGVTASYAIRRDGTAWAWGGNSNGELGVGDTNQRTSPTFVSSLGPNTGAGSIRQIVGGAYGAAALMSDGRVRVWGSNSAGQFGTSSPAQSTTPTLVPNVEKQVAIAGGWTTYATANAGGRLTVWGATSNNQLADGTSPGATAPKAAGIDVSPYRLPGVFVRGNRDATGRLATSVFDRLGNLRSSRSGRGNAIFSSTYDQTTGYDQAQRATWSVTAANRTGAKTSTVEFDPFGNAIKTINAKGFATRATYDSVNRQTSSQTTRAADQVAAGQCSGTATSADFTLAQNGHRVCVSSATYDGLDRAITGTDATSFVTRSWYDAAGRQTRVDAPRTASEILTSRWTYDRDGNLLDACTPRQRVATNTCTSTGLHSTHMQWDRAGTMSSETRYRDSSPTVTLESSYKHDADGNVIKFTDPNGHSTDTTYDFQGRRVTEERPRSQGRTNTTTWKYDAAGNVTAVVAPGSLNTGSGVDGNLVVDGTTAANSTDAQVHGASNPFKIPDGAQYRNVTLQNGAVVTAAATNGLMFHATGTVDVCSTCSIDMAGKGRAGGAGATGIGKGADADNPNSTDVKGTGGLGGGGDITNSGSGGGGGGHKNAGTNGTGPAGGVGGRAVGADDFTDVGTNYSRGSGGGGGGGGKGLLGNGGKGGDGGGFVRITASKIIINGKVDAAGAKGGSGDTNSAGGGGGAGGGIWLAAQSVDLAANDVLKVSGGAGGSGGQDRAGGAGSTGFIRIDSDQLTNQPAGASTTKAAMITAYSYDAANRVVDTVEGAQTTQADPNVDSGEFAVPDTNGFANTRTRTLYTADGLVGATLPSQAFGDAASLMDPKTNTARRVDYDLDGRAIAAYTPRYDTTTASVGDGNDGGAGINQQTSQCSTGRVTDQVEGIKPYSTAAGVCVTRSRFDAVGNIDLQVMPSSNGSDNRYLAYSYTPDNLVRSVTGPDPREDNDRVTVATTTYDGAGRPLVVQDAKGHSRSKSYFADGLVKETTEGFTQAGGPNINRTNTFTYDANGNAVTSSDAMGAITTTSWFSDGLLEKIEAPGTGGSNTTRYGYDKVGNTTSVRMPNQNSSSGPAIVHEFTDDNLLLATHTPITSSTYRSVRYTYSRSGWKVATETARCTSSNPANCEPSNGSWQSAGTMRVTYGANGRPADEIGRTRKSISTTYDPTGQPKQVRDPISGINVNASYYLDGNLRTVDDGRNENTYAYDASGQPTVRTDKTSSTGATSGSKVTTSYAYNAAGRVKRMESGVLAKPTTYAWDEMGRAKTETTDGHVNTWSWNPDGSVAGVETKAGGDVKASFQYTYNNNGDISRQVATGGKSYTNDYTYTPARNVSTWTRTPSGEPAVTNQYGWDRNNNRVSVAVKSGSASTFTTERQWSYNEDNSLQNTTAAGVTKSFSYDNAGRLTTDPCAQYTYDDFDRIATAKDTAGAGCSGDGRETSYEYDGLDRQREMSVTGSSASGANVTTRTVFNGLTTEMIGQTNAANVDHTSPTTMYQLSASGMPFAMSQSVSSTGKVFLDSDGQDNIATLVTTSGDRTCSVVYDPQGDPIDTSGTSRERVCSSGSSGASTTANTSWYRAQARDANTGNYQLGTRTYDPETAAFTTPDAYRVADSGTDTSVTTDPLTANTYTYANGNPVNMSDPSGHRVTCGSSGNDACDSSVQPTGKPLSRKAFAAWQVRQILAKVSQTLGGVGSQKGIAAVMRRGWNSMPKWQKLPGEYYAGVGSSVVSAIDFSVRAQTWPAGFVDDRLAGGFSPQRLWDEALDSTVPGARGSSAYRVGEVVGTIGQLAAGGVGSGAAAAARAAAVAVRAETAARGGGAVASARAVRTVGRASISSAARATKSIVAEAARDVRQVASSMRGVAASTVGRSSSRLASGSADIASGPRALDVGPWGQTVVDVRRKLPESWGPGSPARKKVGWRWQDPANPQANVVRVDKGDSGSNFETQRVDHVVLSSDGRVIGRSGKPIAGSIKEDPVNAHIPLSDWMKWSTWNSP